MKETVRRLFREEFNSLLIMNLVTTLLCLTVIGAGPAAVAMTGTLSAILDNRCELKRLKTFWKLLKEKFWAGVLLEVVFGGYAVVLIWCASLAKKLTAGGAVVMALVMLAAFLAAIISVCAVAVIGSVKMPFGAALWNAACMALGRLPRAALSAALVYGLGYVAILLYPISLLLYAVIMLSVMAVLGLSALWPALEELILRPIEKENAED